MPLPHISLIGNNRDEDVITRRYDRYRFVDFGEVFDGDFTMADTMEGKLDLLSRQIGDMSQSIQLLTRTVNNVEASFDKKIEELKQSLDRKIDDTLVKKKEEIRDELRGELNQDVDSLRQELDATKLDLADTKAELARIRVAVEPPYSPDKSVVIYGLKSNEEEAVQDTVRWLFSTVLQAEANIVNVERIEPKGTGQIGVIRVELTCVEEKINVLRAKRRCVNTQETKDVVIRTCDSHESRVHKLNCRKMLSLMPGGKDYLVADNGLIKRKTNLPGGGGDEALTPEGSNPAEEDTQMLTGQVGDIRQPRAHSESDHGGRSRGGSGNNRGSFGAGRGGRPTNQGQGHNSTTGPEHLVNNNTHGLPTRGRGNAGPMRGAGRGDGIGRGAGRGAPGGRGQRGGGQQGYGHYPSDGRRYSARISNQGR